MTPAVKIAAATLLAGAAYYFYRSRLTQTDEVGYETAGDQESSFIEDGMDTMTGTLSGWPPGSAPYRSMIESAAAQHGVQTSILAWLLWKESRYTLAIVNGTKRSPVGAMGIAQFMPATAREELGSEAAALNPAIAIPGAARYLRKLYNSLGAWDKALAAYNWGIGNVQRKGLDKAPAETRDYYSSILARAGGIGGVFA